MQFQKSQIRFAFWLIIIIVVYGIESMKVILNPNTVCQHVNKKNMKGKLAAICNNQQLYNEVKRGIELGLNECETLFKYRRWNCTNLRKSMKKMLMKDTKETGFIYAITSAGVTYSVTKSCSMGTLIDCSCDKSHSNKKHYAIQSKTKANNKIMLNNSMNSNPKNNNINYLKNYHSLDQHLNLKNNNNNDSITTNEIAFKKYATNNKQQTNHVNHHHQKIGKNYPASTLSDGLWEWSGCDDNVNYGYKQSRDFFDTRMRKRSDLNVIRLHNSEVGRLAVKSHMRPECKCHGISGSCVTKTCWMKLVPFYEVGNILLANFDKAFKVITKNDGNGLKPIDQKKRHQLMKRRLVYSEDSPDFCLSDHSVGSLGIKGRECDPMGDDSKCHAFCCKRGFSREVVTIETSCNCVFHWCCEVKCDKCSREKEVLRCN